MSCERSHKCSLFPSELCWLSRQIRPFLQLHVTSFLCLTAGSLLALLTPLVLKWLIDRVIPQRQGGLLLLAVGIVFLGHQGKAVLTGIGTYLTLSAAQQMGLRLRMGLLRHLDTLSADYYEDTAVGITMYPFKEPIDEISYFGSDLLPAILRALLTTGFTVATMFVLNLGLTFALLPLLPAFLMARQHFRRRLTTDADFVQADRRAMNDFLEEHLSGVTAIQLLGQRKRQEGKAFQGFARAVRSQQRLFRSGVWFTVATSFAVVLSMCAVVGYGGWKALTGALSVGTLVAFYSFIAQLFDPLSGAAELYARTQKIFASIRQVRAAFDLRPSIVNASTAVALSQTYAPSIEFASARFGYGRHKNMLQIPSLRISAGEKVAMVGENGAGKSTLAKLIARLYDLDSGSLRIGGEDIRNIDLDSLWRYVCYLPRDPVLFNGTLLSNLRFVRPAVADVDLQNAMNAVGLSAFVSTLPDGIHQRIGPDACQLSGGQRQRLAIARALLQRPQILILDEATSCLDPSSEGFLLREIQRVLCSPTLIVVSHRLSTLATFERVLVLSKGRIVEDGHPESFLATRSIHSTLFDSTASTSA